MEENENMLDQKQNKISRTQEEIKQRSLHHIFARNATEWITVRDFANSEDCVAFCRKQGYKLWVTVRKELQEKKRNESHVLNKILTLVNTIFSIGNEGSFTRSRSIERVPKFD